MTDTTREILEKYQVRKTKKQKSAFIHYVKQLSDEWAYSCRIEKGIFGSRNIVIGDPSRAKVVYTAHYDTCPVLPFPNFITPTCFFLYLLYQIVLTVGILGIIAVLSIAVGVAAALLSLDGYTVDYIIIGMTWILCYLLLAGPANKHTANDNTSGVTLLIDIMRDLPTDQRDNVALVFFDLEEAGLWGSMSFKIKHKVEMKHRLLMNFDCVSDGATILLALRKGAVPYRAAIEAAFPETDGFQVRIADRGVLYPSDQALFRSGVGVAALRSTKGGLLYMNRIHTKRDVIYREENIEYLKKGAISLAQQL